MPTPRKNEKKDDYMKRCVPMVMEEGTAKDNKQAVAICMSMFKQHKKKMMSRGAEIMEEVANILKPKE